MTDAQIAAVGLLVGWLVVHGLAWVVTGDAALVEWKAAPW